MNSNYGHRRHEWQEGKCKVCSLEQCEHEARDKNTTTRRRCKNSVADPNLWPGVNINPKFCSAHQSDEVHRFKRQREALHFRAHDFIDRLEKK